MCIISGYAAIAHFTENPVFGVMYYTILYETSLTYVLMYEKGFKVPDQIQQAKSLLRLRAKRRGGLVRMKALVRELISIPPVGVKVGEFHMMERTSALVFLHYVLTNIVNMLVAYR